jgi:glycerol-3-phosphate dehydrogenase
MSTITRDIERHSREKYDLIIIGGGIYGIMLLLEATRRKLRCLLVEEKDFGGQTSLNHLRTIHGGLRYLQTLDLKRFRESIKERKWFFRTLPALVKPMPCLMPLYGKGLKRRSILRMAVLINDLLSLNRNRGIHPQWRLARSRTINSGSVEKIFPAVNREGLQGGAVWHDGGIEEYQRLLMEILKFSLNQGGKAFNYLKATDLLTSLKKVNGILTRDMESGRVFEFQAPVVINATGPWSRDLARQFDRDYPSLFLKRLLNWNVLFDRESLSSYSLGLTASQGKGHTYFFHNWKNRLLVGTGELVVDPSNTERIVPRRAMEKFMADINELVPGLALTEKNILRVYSGVLPATRSGRLSVRETIINHANHNGPRGLYSISGVKFTTSRLVAEKVIRQIFPDLKKIPDSTSPIPLQIQDITVDYDWIPENDSQLTMIKVILEKESVIHLGDLLLRRTSIGDNPLRARKILNKIKKLFDWDDRRWNTEVELLEEELRAFNIFSLPHH